MPQIEVVFDMATGFTHTLKLTDWRSVMSVSATRPDAIMLSIQLQNANISIAGLLPATFLYKERAIGE